MATEVTREQAPQIATDSHSQWILIEREMKLLAIGDRIFPGTSVRRSLDPAGRAIFMTEVRHALETGESIDKSVTHGDLTYRVVIDPLVSPRSGDVVAAIGAYVPSGEEADLPSKPTIGCWEWEVAPPKAGQHVSSYWNEDLYRLYDLESQINDCGPGAYPTPQWFNAIIAPEDRARMRLVIDEGIRVGNDSLHTVAYTVITGYGTRHRGRRRLRLSGRAYNMPDGRMSLRGVSHEIEEPLEDTTPGLASARTDGFLRAAFELSGDIALAAIDTRYSEIYMTSPGWTAAGLPLVLDGSLNSLVHPDDQDDFREYLGQAALSSRPTQRTIEPRLKTTDGEFKSFDFHAMNASSGEINGRYVLARITPLEN